MFNFRALSFAACLAVLPVCTQASWLRCIASGGDDGQAFAVDTAVVNVGRLSPDRMAGLKRKLLDYVRKGTPDASDLQANCFASENQDAATAHFSRSWMAMVRRLGWQNVSVITPDVWLADSDYADGADTGDN